MRRRLGEFIVSNEIMRGGEWRNFTGGFFFVVVPVIAIKNPTAAAVPIDFLMS